MSDEKPDWTVFSEDLDRPRISLEERAKEIAAILESGNASDLFIRQLAEMIKPDGKHSDLVLTLQYKRKHEPKRQAWRVGEEMMRLVDEVGVSVDEAVYQVQQAFGEKGCSRSMCLEAMKKARALERAWQNLSE